MEPPRSWYAPPLSRLLLRWLTHTGHPGPCTVAVPALGLLVTAHHRPRAPVAPLVLHARAPLMVLPLLDAPASGHPWLRTLAPGAWPAPRPLWPNTSMHDGSYTSPWYALNACADFATRPPQHTQEAFEPFVCNVASLTDVGCV
jgi:hypothetical protein